MASGNDRKLTTIYKSCTLRVTQRTNTLPLEELRGYCFAGPNRVIDLVLPIPIRVSMPAPPFRARRSVER